MIEPGHADAIGATVTETGGVAIVTPEPLPVTPIRRQSRRDHFKPIRFVDYWTDSV